MCENGHQPSGLPSESSVCCVVALEHGTTMPSALQTLFSGRNKGGVRIMLRPLLRIPYTDVMQACLLPLAYTEGTDFKPGKREPLDSIVHWDNW